MDTPLCQSFGNYHPCTQCRLGLDPRTALGIADTHHPSHQCDYIERASSNRYDYRRPLRFGDASWSNITFAPYGHVSSPSTYYTGAVQDEHCPRVMNMVLQREESEMLNTSSILSMAYNHSSPGLKNVSYSPFEPLDPRRMKYPVVDNPNVFTYNPVIPRYVAL